MTPRRPVAALAAALLSSATPAGAAVIFEPTGVRVESGGPGFGSPSDTIDQSGLLTRYRSGVSDFDAYVASRPLHDPDFRFEWFSNENTSAASLVFDLGAPRAVDGVAYWNEDAAGAGRVDFLGSLDGAAFFTLLAGATLTNNPLVGENGVPYAPDVFRFPERTARFVRVQLSGCPQPEGGAEFPSCSIGEIAFRVESPAPVPAPAAAILFAPALGTAFLLRRQKKGRPQGRPSRRDA